MSSIQLGLQLVELRLQVGDRVVSVVDSACCAKDCICCRRLVALVMVVRAVCTTCKSLPHGVFQVVN